MKVLGSTCCRYGALMKSCYAQGSCAAGRICQRVVSGGGSAILFSRDQSPRAARVYVCFISALPRGKSRAAKHWVYMYLFRLLTNSLTTSPLLITFGFATKTKSRQLRRLAIGSYTIVLAAAFSLKCHLHECLNVFPYNPCRNSRENILPAVSNCTVLN